MNAATNTWVPVAGCGGTPGALNVPIMEALSVTGQNALAPLSQTPDMALMLLIINGRVFMPLGASPPFAVSGAQITWTSSLFSFAPGDEVNAVYTYTGG
jgi:hypothetical protein